jgi:RHS repeat-associated protein
MLTLGRSRSLVLVLIGGLGAALLLALAFGGAREVGLVGRDGAAPVTRPPARAGGLSRVVGARQLVPGASSRFSSTYRLGDGTMLTRVSSAPVNFRDSRGQWRAIDATLVARDGAYVNRAGAHGVRLPRRLSDGVQVSAGGERLSMRLLGADGAAAVRGARARYPEVLPAVSAIYDSQAGRLREQLVLSDRRAPVRFVFALSASRGLQARQRPSGDVVFSRAGRQVFVLPASFAFAQGDEAETHGLKSALRRSGRGWTLTVAANRGWVHGALAHGPVVIDPTVVVDPDSQDCTIESDTPTTSYCSSNSLIVGYDARSPAHDHRSLVQFDVSAVPRDAVVLNATLELYLGSRTTTNLKQVGAYPVVRPWTNGVTWNSYDGTNAWTSPGASNSLDASTTADSVRTVGDTLNDWVDWYPTKAVQGWVNGTLDNHGLLMRDVTPNTTDNEFGFASRENSSEPNMEIEWAPRTGQLGSYTFDSQRLGDRTSLAVNVANGNLLLSNSDVHVAGTGLDVDLTHYHNSMGTGFGLQGVGIPGTASLGRDVKLTAFADGSVAFYKGDGVVLPFLDRTVSGSTASFLSPPDLNATLTQDTSTGVYTLTFNRTEVREIFNSAGQLTSIKDRNDNTISLTYYGYSGKGLKQITDTQGRVLSVTQVAGDGYLDTITDPTGRTWDYTYGHFDTDYLTDYQDPSGHHTVYDYDSSHRLNSITTPAGNVTKITYDGTSERVATVKRTTDAGHTTGPTTSYAYSTGSPCTTGQSKTVITDPNGHTTTYCSDSLDRVRIVKDQLGNQHEPHYTLNGDADTIIDTPGGTGTAGTTTLTYDTAGNNTITDVTAPEGENTHLTYYSTGETGSGGALARFHPKQITDDQGTSEFFSYDNNGNLTDVGDAASSPRNKAHLTYNANGTPATATDGNLNTTTFGHDTAGNLTSITPPTPLQATTITVDGLSRVHTVKTGSSGATRTLTYDALDRVTRADVSDGSYFTYTYDDDGNLTQRADSALNTTSYTVDPLGRRTHEGFPGSKSNDYTYDAGGNLKTIVDAAGTVTYNYDAINRVTSIVSPTASGSSTDTVSYSYDDPNRTQTMTLPGSTTEKYSADKSGNTTSITIKNSGGTVLRSLAYDYSYVSGTTKHGSLIRSVTDQGGQKTTYTYKDSAVPEDVGRLVKARTETSGGSLVEEFRYAYDKAGNRTKLEDQTSSTTTTTMAYNAANELCWKFAGSSSNTCGSPPTGATSYSYDGNGHGNETAAGSTAYSYDALDRATGLAGTAAGYLTPDNGELVSFGTTSYQNNLLGLSRQFAPSATTNYVRDPSGAPVSQRTSSSKQFFLNGTLGSTIALTDTSGAIVRSYSYDPDGNATSTGSGATTDLKFAGGHQIGGLYHYGARYYDPGIARWTQQDPINQYDDLTAANRYAYAAGNSINASDPAGLLSLKKVVHYVSDKAKSVTERLGGAADERLYCAGAIVTLTTAGAVAGNGPGAALGLAAGAGLCGALHVARNTPIRGV